MGLLDVIRDRSFEANFLNIRKNVLYVMAGSDFILHTYLDLSQVLWFLIILRPAFFSSSFFNLEGTEGWKMYFPDWVFHEEGRQIFGIICKSP